MIVASTPSSFSFNRAVCERRRPISSSHRAFDFAATASATASCNPSVVGTLAADAGASCTSCASCCGNGAADNEVSRCSSVSSAASAWSSDSLAAFATAAASTLTSRNLGSPRSSAATPLATLNALSTEDSVAFTSFDSASKALSSSTFLTSTNTRCLSSTSQRKRSWRSSSARRSRVRTSYLIMATIDRIFGSCSKDTPTFPSSAYAFIICSTFWSFKMKSYSALAKPTISARQSLPSLSLSCLSKISCCSFSIFATAVLRAPFSFTLFDSSRSVCRRCRKTATLLRSGLNSSLSLAIASSLLPIPASFSASDCDNLSSLRLAASIASSASLPACTKASGVA
mmetsp:Transcript_131372/g.255981  ORF Transcript_131372/g.255981 Transcript_131372/m.255981 type:complete len:343 (+) Transcript_131372:794-1822(+)